MRWLPVALEPASNLTGCRHPLPLPVPVPAPRVDRSDSLSAVSPSMRITSTSRTREEVVGRRRLPPLALRRCSASEPRHIDLPPATVAFWLAVAIRPDCDPTRRRISCLAARRHVRRPIRLRPSFGRPGPFRGSPRPLNGFREGRFCLAYLITDHSICILFARYFTRYFALLLHSRRCPHNNATARHPRQHPWFPAIPAPTAPVVTARSG